MRGGLRQRAGRACLVAAGVCVLFAFAAPSSRAQEDDTIPLPEVFRGVASSQVVSVKVDRDALLPVPDLMRFTALDGASMYESSTRQARASLLFPGNGLILGPNLACGTFGGMFPPDFKPIFDTCLKYQYPLTVFADDFQPDGATEGSLALGAPTDPVSGNAVSARAHAAEDGATTDAVLNDLRVLGPPAFGFITPDIPGFETDESLVTIDGAVSRTSQRVVKGVLAVDAEATMTGVRLFGGLIEIGSLRSRSHVTDDAAGKRSAVPALEVGGVTVGGMPAQITDAGLVLGPSANASPLDQQRQGELNEVLRELDIKVTILGAEKDPDQEGAAVASVGGLLIEFGRDVQGLPTIPGPVGELDPNGFYTGSFQLGSTAVLASAVNYDDDFTSDLDPEVPDFGDGGFDLGSSNFDSGGGSYEGAFTPDDAPEQPSAVASPGTERPATGGGTLVRSLGDRFGDRMGLVYLSLMFAVLGCCIAPGFTVPSRFGGR